MKADEILAPEVTREQGRSEESYRGTWAALHACGAVPEELTEAPPARRGGSWFKDQQGRSWRISRFGWPKPVQTFRVTRVRTVQERAELERSEALANKRAAVAAEVDRLHDLTEQKLRAEMRGWVSTLQRGLLAVGCGGPVLSTSPETFNPGRFTYTPAFAEELDRLCAKLRLLVSESEVVEDDTALQTARRSLRALTDPAFRGFMAMAEGSR